MTDEAMERAWIGFCQDRKHSWQSNPDGPRYELPCSESFNAGYQAALKAHAPVPIDEKARSLIECMIENDPNDYICDGGHTMLDLWRHDAKALLKIEPPTIKEVKS